MIVKNADDLTKTKKLEKSLKMLELLKNNGRMKRWELAKKLGLKNERSIGYYKDTLRYLGYQIVSYGGYEGGYELIEKEKITHDELNYLKTIINDSLYQKIFRINENL